MNFCQLAFVMANKYNFDTRRLAVQLELVMLTLESFMVDRRITDIATRLTKLVEHVNILTPQYAYNFRSDINKIRFLPHAVLTQPWAERTISSITTAKFTLNSFVTALRKQLQLQIKKATNNRIIFSQTLPAVWAESQKLYLQSQPAYQEKSSWERRYADVVQGVQH